MNCVFCKIANGEIPSQKIYEDEKILAFYDLNPQAPVHFLVIPKEHIISANDIDKDNSGIIGHIFEIISKLSYEFKLSGGYRIVNNCGKDGGQNVDHMHFHVLGGRFMEWPPG